MKDELGVLAALAAQYEGAPDTWPKPSSADVMRSLHIAYFSRTALDALGPLAHPARLHATAADAIIRSLWGQWWQSITQALREEPTFVLAYQRIIDECPGLHDEIQELYGLPARLTVNAGIARIMMHYLWWRTRNGAHIRATDALHTLMRHSDIGDVPLDLVRLPYPAVYVEFGSRNNPDALQIEMTDGAYVVEGVYLLDGHMPASRVPKDVLETWFPGKRIAPDAQIRELACTVTGSPVGRDNLTDDSATTMSLILTRDDASTPILEAMERAYRRYRRVHEKRRAFRDLPTPAQWDGMRAALDHAVKVLLYMGLREARLARRDERSRQIAVANRRQGAKRAKALRRAAALYDRIEVGPERLPQPMAEPSAPLTRRARRSPRPHWRRGHWHAVRHGPGRSLRRIDWRPPVLVRAEALDENEPRPAPADYDVGID